MNTFALKIAVSVLLLGTLASCRTHKAAQPERIVKDSSSVVVTPRKVDIAVKGDTSGSVSQLKVKDGKIVLDRELTAFSSSKVAKPIIEIDTAGILNVKCPCLDQVVQAEVADTTKTNSHVERITEVRYENYLTGFQNFQIWGWWIIVALSSLWVIFRIIKRWVFPLT